MTDSTEPKPTPAHNPMTRPVLIAGLLGGVLGAIFAFILSRSFPDQPKLPPTPPQSEARQYADDLFAKLKAGKNEEFLAGVRQAFSGRNDEEFREVRQELLKLREEPAKVYGASVDFEFVRETTLGPNLVRFAYLEKFQHGCVMWIIVFYNAPDGWQVLAYRQLPLDAAFAMLR